MSFSLKKFETQNEVDEKKKRRQEEWEKVRKPDDPEECPEEPIDNRSLYDKLEEQRQKKQDEFEEKVAFRNQVRRLDADETDFLDFCTEIQQDIKEERKQEENKILSEMRDARVVKVEDTKQEQKKARPTQPQIKKTQQSLLAGAVKRKGSEDSSSSKKQKSEPSDGAKESCPSESPAQSIKPQTTSGVAKVVAVLPVALQGLTNYEDSSDSVSSSSDSECDFTLATRQRVIIQGQIQQQ